MPKNPTARAYAQATGAVTYETGIPCKQGHVAPRATRTGTCVECTKLASLRWLQQRPTKAAEYTAAYRDRNRLLVQVKDRIAKQQLRAQMPDHVRAANKKSYRRKAAQEGRQVLDANRLLESTIAERLQAVHGSNIVYLSGYRTMHADAVFQCTVHGSQFFAAPHNVLRGANPCMRCNHMASKGEDAVAAFLASFTEVRRRDRTLIKPRELDIYLPEAKLAVEYCGEFWHSSGSAADERKIKLQHAEKHRACAALGIRLITLYESEWQEHNYAVRRLLRNAIGRSRGKLMARKCTLNRVSNDMANEFYARYHPQGGAGTGEHYGLFWKGKLAACMRFTFGANDRGRAERVWTLSRYATRVTVVGGASRLFNAFLREHQPTEVKSFSDNRFFDGGMYEALGFALEAELSPDYQVWSPKIGLRPKSHYQRRVLPRRLQEHGVDDEFNPATDPRTESDMTYLMGCRRLYDCGKKKWVWRVDTPSTT